MFFNLHYNNRYKNEKSKKPSKWWKVKIWWEKKYSCPNADQFYYHNQTGSIHNYNRDKHKEKPGSHYLHKQTTILYRSSNKMNLCIAEAIYIKQQKSKLNKQEK